MREQPVDCCLSEQVRAEFRGDQRALRPLFYGQRQIKFRRAGVQWDWRNGQAGQFQTLRQVGLEYEHHLDQWPVTRTAQRLKFLHQPLEGQVLMRIGVEGHLANAPQHFPEGGIAGQVSVQRQSVDEKSNQPFSFKLAAAGDGRAHDELCLSRVAVKQNFECRQQCHKHRSAFSLTESLQRFDQPFWQEPHRPPARD